MKVLKRYANRRLYDADTSKTVTLDEVAQYIREGHDVRVVDNLSGDDITTKILSQTFLRINELSVGGNSAFLNFILTTLIRESDRGAMELVQRLMFAGVGISRMTAAERKSLMEAFKNFNRDREGVVSFFADLADKGQQETDRVWSQFSDNVSLFSDVVQRNVGEFVKPLSERKEFHFLVEQIDRIRGRIEGLPGKAPGPPEDGTPRD